MISAYEEAYEKMKTTNARPICPIIMEMADDYITRWNLENQTKADLIELVLAKDYIVKKLRGEI